MSFRRDVQIIFQDPYSSLDSRYIVGKWIEEPLLVHRVGDAGQRRKRAIELMNEVGLREDQFTRYPHELSGGQRQRIGIARALALGPSLIICDEPVSALDVSIQAQILNLLKSLQRKHGFSYIFISHDLRVINHICSKIAVMYLGHIVELAGTDDLFGKPLHPYTSALLSAVPEADPEIRVAGSTLEGEVPSAMNPPSGCCFHTRCNHAMSICSCTEPRLMETKDGHHVACHLYVK
jgi:oligopeptide/dipeptide ABC transporter ATP-binding protein